MTAILQITDTHIVGEGRLVSGHLETAGALTRLVDRLKSIRHQIGPVDAVIVSGDLSDDGSKESYARFKALLAPLDLPTFVIPGNHDARDPLRGAFADHLPIAGPLNWVRKIGDVSLVGLDSLVEGHGHGTLSSETLAFLRDALVKADGSAVLLALHHPPFSSGISFMDAIGLTNAQDLRDLVSGYKGELRIVCGHIHSMMVCTFGGHTAISAPSPCSTFAYDNREDSPVGFLTQDDGCLLHRWDAGFQTIRIGPEAGSGPFPF
ncbi:MAG: phosphodiesterase [Paracoccaceae bacterium]|nr:phosphodiesterase [Paracoccaceae bacterium]